MKETYPDMRLFYVTLENTQEMFLLIQGEITEEELERKLNRRVYQNITEEDQPVWTFAVSDQPEEIQNIVEKLRKCYLYGIRLGYRTIIT